MFRSLTKPVLNAVELCTFSTYKVKGNYPFRINSNQGPQQEGSVTKDAERVFEQFFRENPPKQSEKSFFDMNYSDQSEMLAFNPYKILGIQAGASQQKIKQAYRELAMKYHPKNDSSAEAGEKFINAARAYQMLIPLKKEKKNNQSGLTSFMSEFNNSVREYMNNEAGIKTSYGQKGKSQVKIAQLYSESTNVKRLGDKKQVKIEKQYNRDGNLIKITRIENFNEDGSVQISETFDDGYDVKTNKFMQQNGATEPTPIDNHIQWNKDDLFVANTGNYEMAAKTEKQKRDQKQGKPKQKKQEKKQNKDKKDSNDNAKKQKA